MPASESTIASGGAASSRSIARLDRVALVGRQLDRREDRAEAVAGRARSPGVAVLGEDLGEDARPRGRR
jgi:hypothetical protein